MNLPSRLYAPSVWLLTDLYQLTMADVYRRAGIADRDACFYLSFRKNPFGGGYALAAGLEWAVDFIENTWPSDTDFEYLASLRTDEGRRLFKDDFLAWLGSRPNRLDVDAVPEGTVVFPHEPLLRVSGPIAEAQLLESALCNLVNFQTLIATKTARVCEAAGGDPVVEFGMRRAQGIDGAIAASRAAWIGGCAATSHVLAGRLFDIPVRGTHAHSSVLAFEDEEASFEAFLAAARDGSTLLVDTFDSVEGTRRAAHAARALSHDGRALDAIRLDSGDLARLSIECRRVLDEAGLRDTRVFASGDLDERRIARLKAEGARIDAWGVGTRLMTGHPDGALGGVYKLCAIRLPGRRWEHRLKRSDEPAKSTLPGLLAIRRFEDEDGRFAGDAIVDELLPEPEEWEIVDPGDPERRAAFGPGSAGEDLLVPVFRKGERVWEAPSLEAVRRRAREQLGRLPPEVRRLDDPDPYPVGLERSLHELRAALLSDADREHGEEPASLEAPP